MHLMTHFVSMHMKVYILGKTSVMHFKTENEFISLYIIINKTASYTVKFYGNFQQSGRSPKTRGIDVYFLHLRLKINR